MTRYDLGIAGGYLVTEESDVAVRVHVDISAENPEDVMLDISEDSIQVAAETSEDIRVAEGIMSAQDMVYRRIPLPAGLDVEQLEIEVDNGHIDVVIPKK